MSFQVVVQGPEGRTPVLLEKAENFVGRAAQSDILVPHEEVSRKHMRFILSDGRVFAVDDGSRNGTFVDGHKLAPGNPLPIEEGQAIKLGLAPHILSIERIRAHQLVRDPALKPVAQQRLAAPEDLDLKKLKVNKLAKPIGGEGDAEPSIRPRDSKAEESAVRADGFKKKYEEELSQEWGELKKEIAELKLKRQELFEEIAHLEAARNDLGVKLAREVKEQEKALALGREKFSKDLREAFEKTKDRAQELLQDAESRAQLIRQELALELQSQRDAIVSQASRPPLRPRVEALPESSTKSSVPVDLEEDTNPSRVFPETVVAVRPSAGEETKIGAPLQMAGDSTKASNEFAVDPGVSSLWLTSGAFRGNIVKKMTAAVGGVTLLVAMGAVGRAYWIKSRLGPGASEWASNGSERPLEPAVRREFEPLAQTFLTGELGLAPDVAARVVTEDMNQFGRRQAEAEHRRWMESALGGSQRHDAYLRFRDDFLKKKR